MVMIGKKISLIGVAVFILAGAFTISQPQAHADSSQSRQSRGMSLDQAVAQVQRQTGGRVLRARQQGQVYVIKVLMPNGVVKTYTMRAR